ILRERLRTATSGPRAATRPSRLDLRRTGGRLNVFISYRRRESAGYSGRIHDRLRADLPAAQIFLDVEAIVPGEDWRARLAQRIAAAEVVLVLIGSEWRSTADASGQRRLDDPHDVTRWEIETALARGK